MEEFEGEKGGRVEAKEEIAGEIFIVNNPFPQSIFPVIDHPLPPRR